MDVFCPECGRRASLALTEWRCPCGGAWEPPERTDFDPAAIDSRAQSIWRYRHHFGLDPGGAPLSLSAGWTPLVQLPAYNPSTWFKLDFLAPTGSFKDRGTEVMINVVRRAGATRVADDSSGNAGASVAAYAARAGLEADIFIPAHASPAKQAQIEVYGARVHPVEGPREKARLAAWALAAQGVVLASHVYHPAFLLGQQSVAWEVWEQMGRRAPDWFVVPVGQGVHLLGAWLGFRRLRAAGLVERLPRLVGVQPALLPPVCEALHAGLDHVPGVEPRGTSVAEGLAIAEPVRGRRVLQALRETGGRCLIVTEDEIVQARAQLAHRGLFVEPTSATAVAAMEPLAAGVRAGETVVVVLTGSGLKGSPTISLTLPLSGRRSPGPD